jgi:hypothetical protein
MTPTGRRVLTIAGLSTILCFSSTNDVRAQNLIREGGLPNPGDVTVRVVNGPGTYDGAARIRRFALQNASKMKEGTVPFAGKGLVEVEDDDDNKRAAVYIDDVTDGLVDVIFVVDGATPPALDGTRRRRIGEVVLRRGAAYVVDVGSGTITDSSAPGAQPLDVTQSPRFVFYGTGLATRSMISSTADFCAVNATLLNSIGATQSSCNWDRNSSAFGGGGGMLFRFLRNATRGVIAGGYNRGGQTVPQAEGNRTPLNIRRNAVEKFTGPYAAAGVHMNFYDWYVQSVFGAAWLTRRTSTTDTFALNGQVVQTSSIDRREEDVQPYLAIEAGRTLVGPLSFGMEYSFTRFVDSQKTENLHRLSGTVRVSVPGPR